MPLLPAMSDPHTKTPTLKSKLKTEAWKAFVLTLYFGLWFCALTFLAATTLREWPIPLTIFGFALIKAVLCAKFMLLSQSIFPLSIKENSGIIRSLVAQSIFYLAMVMILTALETAMGALIHGHAFIQAFLNFFTADPIHLLASAIVYWLIVWPYLIFAGMLLYNGKDKTHQMLLGRPTMGSDS